VPSADKRPEVLMIRISLLALMLHPLMVVGQVIAQPTSLGSGIGGGGIGGSSGIGGGGIGGGGIGGGGMSSGNQFIGNQSGGFGLGFMKLGMASGRAGSANSTGSTSFMGPYYATPLAIGYGPLNSGSTQAYSPTNNPAFGVAFANTGTAGGTNSGRGTAGGLGGVGAMGAQGASNLTGSVDFVPLSSSGIRRNLPYAAEVNFEGSQAQMDGPGMAAAKLTNDLNSVIARSSRLPSASGIDVSIDQGIVVLKGAVASDKERRVLEAMVRMSPGVREIRNEVRVGR